MTNEHHAIDQKIGATVRVLRLRRGLGVKACAELCGRTDEWLRQVEKGEQPLDKLSTVVLLARVLGINDLGKIVGPRLEDLTCSLTDQGRARHNAVAPLQRVLSTPLYAGHSVSDVGGHAQKIKRRIDLAWAAWHASPRQYTVLGVVAADILTDALRLHRGAERDERVRTWPIVSEALQLAQRFLFCVGEAELAARAADRAMVAAEESDNPILMGVASWTSTMAALGGGRPAEAADVALNGIEHLSALANKDPRALSVEGALHLFAAVSMAHQRKGADAWRLWDRARAAANRLGPKHHHPFTMFGMANVGIYAVSLEVDTGRSSSAVSRGRRLTIPEIPSTHRRAQHLADLARGHWKDRDPETAARMLVECLRHSEEMIRFSPTVRMLIQEMLAGGRSPSADLLRVATTAHLLA